MVDPFGTSAEPGGSTAATVGHTVLDVAGVVPVIGIPADIVSTVWYSAEGDWTNAGLSAVGMIPIIGDVGEAGKLGIKGVKLADKVSDGEKVAKGAAEATKPFYRYWDNVIEFNSNKVYQRSDLFGTNTMSSWKVKGKTVTGTNVERMASGRAPIGYDGKSINLHHLTQTQSGAIAEVSQSFHQSNYSTVHINTGELPSGINRGEFNAWKEDYWINRANDFIK